MTVVKLGGTEGVDFSAICTDAADLLKNGHKLVLVHGGSAEANALGESLGAPPKFITSPSGYTSRHTDRKTLEIFLMAVNGKVNSLLVEQPTCWGSTLCLSGMDGNCCRPRASDVIQSVENGSKIIRDDFIARSSGQRRFTESIDGAGCLPVVAPVAVSEKAKRSMSMRIERRRWRPL
jgi:acetylglutamate/LysW-gamma-L-alpha-aminoadipate kinase